MHLTELTGTAGLLLVTVLGRCNLGDGLAVRHLGSVEFDVLLELVGNSPLHIVDVLLAHTGKDGLTQFLGVFHVDGGILGSHLVEGVAYLGLVVLIHCLHGAAVLGIREHHVLEGLHTALGQGDIRLTGLELHDAADITGADGSNLLFLSTSHGVNGAETLTVASFRVNKVCTFVEGAAHHLEVRNLTKVLLHAGLEDEQGGGAGRVALEGATIHGGLFLSFRRRNHVHDEFHEALYADVFLGGGAEHGDGLSLHKAGTQTLADLVGAKLHGLEELLHEFVRTFGSLLHEFGAELFGLVGICGGDVLLLVLLVIELHGDYIHKAFQTQTGVHRELAEDSLLAEFLADGVAYAIPVGLVVVHLVHGNDHGNTVLIGITAEEGGAHLDTGGTVHDHDGSLHHLEGGKGATGEIVRTGGIDEVNLAAVELCIQRSGVDGLLVGLFEFRVI